MRLTVVVMLLILGANITFAREKRVTQIPNGEVNRCLNCHTLFGGSPRNDFGLDIAADYLDANGDVIWNAALAELDSDNDGGTNGMELLDPNGEWNIGEPDPGNETDVTNPGDPASVSHVAYTVRPNTFHLAQNVPNPFNAATRIAFELPNSSRVRLTIFNTLGEAKRTLVDQVLDAGGHTVLWDGRGKDGQMLESGVYFCRMQTEHFTSNIRLLLIK